MKNRKLAKGLTVLTIITIIGFGTYGFAADTTETADPAASQMTGPMMSGPGHHGKGTHTNCPMMGDRDGKQKLHQNMTPEELEKFEAERDAFHESTKDLKRDIYQKHLELQAEMAKKSPDQKKATAIQKQLSELKTQMDQKRLEHRFNLKAINPDLGIGMGEFHRQGKMGMNCPQQKGSCKKM